MTTQIWHRQIPYNAPEGIRMMDIVERYDLELLQRVKEAKGRLVKGNGEAIPLTWKERLLFALVSLSGTALFCVGVSALWYIVIEEAVR